MGQAASWAVVLRADVPVPVFEQTAAICAPCHAKGTMRVVGRVGWREVSYGEPSRSGVNNDLSCF